MRKVDTMRLLLLAAIWGASFLFLRILVPVFGTFLTAELRVAIAGVAMLGFMQIRGQAMAFGQHWRAYLALGLLNSAIPFSLYAYAAHTLPAGYSAIVNATTPLWGALVAAIALNEKMTLRKAAGMAIGLFGVAFLVRLGPAKFSTELIFGALACLGAAACYGCAGAYSKKTTLTIPPAQMATGSQLGAALLLLPLLPITPVQGVVTVPIIGVALALGLLCSGVAYFLFFRLIADIGSTRTLTVTFLIPLFALLWGVLFLHESVDWITLAGCGFVLIATWLVMFESAAVT